MRPKEVHRSRLPVRFGERDAAMQLDATLSSLQRVFRGPSSYPSPIGRRDLQQDVLRPPVGLVWSSLSLRERAGVRVKGKSRTLTNYLPSNNAIHRI